MQVLGNCFTVTDRKILPKNWTYLTLEWAVSSTGMFKHKIGSWLYSCENILLIPI